MIKLPQIDMRKKSYEATTSEAHRKMAKLQPAIKKALIPKKKPIFQSQQPHNSVVIAA